MARPFRLPTYHDPRAQLMARCGQLLHDLLDTLGQLEQLQQADAATVQADDWTLEEQGPDGPRQHFVSPQLLMEALRSAGHPNHLSDLDTIERVVGDHSDGGAALATLVGCHHDPPHSAAAARAAERVATEPMSMPLPTTCARQSAQSAQSWSEVGNDLRRLADQLSLDNRLKNTSCTQSESDAIVSSSKGSNLGLIQSLMALVLPKKLSYSATFVYVGMRLLKYNFKEF